MARNDSLADSEVSSQNAGAAGNVIIPRSWEVVRRVVNGQVTDLVVAAVSQAAGARLLVTERY